MGDLRDIVRGLLRRLRRSRPRKPGKLTFHATALRRKAVATSSIWLTLLMGLTMLLLGRSAPAEQRRERNFDVMLAWLSLPPNPQIVIVDIDRPTLLAKGQWPWGRDTIAALIAAVAEGKPRAIGIDTLIEGRDERSPAALARRLADMTGKGEIAKLAETLPDGDRRLADALRAAPVTLGIGLNPDRADLRLFPSPVLVRGQLKVDDYWHSESIVGPTNSLAEAASGLGLLVLPADADGRVRRLPLVAVAAGQLWPSLAVEVLRTSGSASAILVSADAGTLEIAGRSVAIGHDGMLRLAPFRPDHWAARTLSALDVVEKPDVRRRLAGQLVLVGSTAPEVGGLRAAASGPLVPTVLLHARAIEQTLAGTAPIRNAGIDVAELIAALAACGLAIWLAHRASAWVAGLVAATLAVLWMGGALALLRYQHLLVDPFLAPAILGGCLTLAGFLTAASSRRREAAIRRRFEQHLAPAIVARLVAQPDLVRLEGEMREITALFTDVEGFTAMTGRFDPRTVVGLLDRYFDGLTQIIVGHGGMVEKIVGDGLHAIFNAPLDLADHPRRAVDCAIAIRDFGERYRCEEQAAAAGFGRTRVGVETGLVVVGDVGGGRKLDYTAHGEAMNMAARLEAANKDLGSSICVGPGTVSRLPNRALRPLGRIEVRGRAEAIDVFDPWPDGMERAERKAYLEAIGKAERDPMAAAGQLEELASLRPDDPVLARLAARLRMVGVSAQLAELDRKLRPEPRPRANYPNSKKRKRR